MAIGMGYYPAGLGEDWLGFLAWLWWRFARAQPDSSSLRLPLRLQLGCFVGFLVGCCVGVDWLVVWCPGHLVLFICWCVVAVSCRTGRPLVSAVVQLDGIDLRSFIAVCCFLQETVLPVCIGSVLWYWMEGVTLCAWEFCGWSVIFSILVNRSRSDVLLWRLMYLVLMHMHFFRAVGLWVSAAIQIGVPQIVAEAWSCWWVTTTG
ncbi:hypothetical protein Nepgr_006588 [Nepenthes gracilis]|uniref:Uncharacterized protein n=1 Tax=Nepenthes gracilis TaxID=150966 RepID=A0AAD3S5G1_NEPGR|nr:hypothetical protein Nepgr_006588 [Nepenthes gracilis]